MSSGEQSSANNLTALLYAMKEDAAWAWKQSMSGQTPDLFNLNRSWDLVVKEMLRREREGR